MYFVTLRLWYMYMHMHMHMHMHMYMYMYMYVSVSQCDCVWVTGLTLMQGSLSVSGDSVTLATERVVFSPVLEVDRLAQLMSEEINQYAKRAPKVTMFSVMVLQQHIVTVVDTTMKKVCKCDTSS